jgi:hypothetical protein
MEATLLVDRDCYGISYENASGEGLIEAAFENPADGDKSVYTGVNDGSFVVTVAIGYEGTSHCTITDADGNLVDEGDVTFGSADADSPQVEPH